MKKYLSIILAAAMICGMTACDDNSSSIADVSSQTSVSDSVTDHKDSVTDHKDSVADGGSSSDDSASDSTSAVDSQANTETTTAPKTDNSSSQSDSTHSSEKSKARLLTEKMESWNQGNVVFEMQMKQDEYEVYVCIDKLDDNVFFQMNLANIMKTTVLTKDGENYMLDDENKHYAKMSAESASENDYSEYMVNVDEDMKPISVGVQKIDGKSYDYEEYSQKNGDEEALIRYYFDNESNLCYCSEAGTTEETIYIPISIRFEKSKNEEHFVVPTDYTEVTEREMLEAQMAGMFGVIGEALGELEDETA